MLSTLSRQICSCRFSMHSLGISVPNIFYSSCRRQFSKSSSKVTLPEGGWDSHMHVIEPKKCPFPKAVKAPQEASMDQALSNSNRLGIPNMVFVQLSTYGYDNTWVLDALKQVGPARGRGVVAFDPEQIDTRALQQWHDLGVRGVRLNFRSSKSVVSRTEIQTTLRKYAEKLRPMKTWSIGLYADMEVLDHVRPLVSELEVKLVLEHFASPATLPLGAFGQPGWNALQSMMEDSRVYVKISAPYLFSRSSDFKEFETLATALISMRNGKGVVFGSDWPHTQSRGYDVMPFLEKVVEWCDGDEDLKLFRDNARELWDA